MNWFRNFMIGRYGTDNLSLFLLIFSMVITLFSSLFGGSFILILLSYALWGWIIFRTLSRNFEARRHENEVFMRGWNWVMNHTVGVRGWFKTQANRIRDRKTHKYYRCPSCHQMVRVPKNKGKVRIICPKCKNEFIRFTGKSPAQLEKERLQKAQKVSARQEKKASRTAKK